MWDANGIGIWGQGIKDFHRRIVWKSHREMVATETQSLDFLGFARDYKGCEQCVPHWPEAAWGLSPGKQSVREGACLLPSHLSGCSASVGPSAPP